jgi:hypothetical protein
MSDPAKRQRLAQAAPQILHIFGLEQVMGIWKDAIDRVITNKRH